MFKKKFNVMNRVVLSVADLSVDEMGFCTLLPHPDENKKVTYGEGKNEDDNGYIMLFAGVENKHGIVNALSNVFLPLELFEGTSLRKVLEATGMDIESTLDLDNFGYTDLTKIIHHLEAITNMADREEDIKVQFLPTIVKGRNGFKDSYGINLNSLILFNPKDEESVELKKTIRDLAKYTK